MRKKFRGKEILHEVDEEEENEEEETEEVEEEEVEEEEIEEEEEVKPKKKKKAKKDEEKKLRYAMFNIPPRIGIVDTETEEMIASGDNPTDAILQSLANLKSQLERVENMIGSILED